MSDSLQSIPWAAARKASLSFTISWSWLKHMSIELVIPSNHIILCRPLHLLPSIFPTIRVFSNKSTLCIRWPKYWNFSISPSSEHSGLISFRIDWFDLLAVQGTLNIVSPYICHEVMGLDAMTFVFQILSFKPTFPLYSSLSSEAL